MARQFDEFEKDGSFEGTFGDADSFVVDSYSGDFDFEDEAGAYPGELLGFAEERELLSDAELNVVEDGADDAFDDPIRVYLGQMGNIPMLTREQERSAATAIERTRRRYRHAVFSFDNVIRESTRLVAKIVEGRLRLDRTVDVSVADIDGKRHIQRILSPALATLRGVLARNREDFKSIVSGRLSRAERAFYQKRISDRRRRAARLLNELNLRTQAIQPFFEVLVERQERLMSALLRARELRSRLEAFGGDFSSKRDDSRRRASQYSWNLGDTCELTLHRDSVEFVSCDPHVAARERERSVLYEEYRELRRFLRRERRSSNETIASLGRRLKKTSQLRDEFKSAKRFFSAGNLRLVVSIAKRYRNRGLGFLDLIQEGNAGLMHAVDKFEYRRGFKFSTYATWWIRQSISKALTDQCRTIRVPNHLLETIKTVRRTAYELTRDERRFPTAQEIATAANLSMTEVRFAQQAARAPLSLDRPVEGCEEAFFGDFVEDVRRSDPLDDINRSALRERLEEALLALSFREREIVRLRFGLVDGYAYTLEEVGQIFGVTRERVRQLESRAVRKLQHPHRSRSLTSFLEAGERFDRRVGSSDRSRAFRESSTPTALSATTVPATAVQEMNALRSSAPLVR